MGSSGRKVRIASIGGGMIGQVHVKAASGLEECEYVALCDGDAGRKTLADQYGAAFYTDSLTMLEQEKPDGVIVAVPNDLHESVGRQCAERGVHIMMEKPIAPSAESAQRLIDAAHKHQVKLLVAHHRRFNPLIEAAREIIQSGELGSIVGLSGLWSMYKPDEYFEAGPWRKQKGGGPILINAIHEIDDLRHMVGEIDRVYAEVSSKTRGFEVEDTISISLRFKDGTPASLFMSDAAPSIWAYEVSMGENPFFFPAHEDFYQILGTKASLSFPSMRKVFYAEGEPKGWQHPLTVEHLDYSTADPYPRQIAHFCRVIEGLEEPRTTGEDALRTLEVTMALAQSGAENRPIQL